MVGPPVGTQVLLCSVDVLVLVGLTLPIICDFIKIQELENLAFVWIKCRMLIHSPTTTLFPLWTGYLYLLLSNCTSCYHPDLNDCKTFIDFRFVLEVGLSN